MVKEKKIRKKKEDNEKTKKGNIKEKNEVNEKVKENVMMSEEEVKTGSVMEKNDEICNKCRKVIEEEEEDICIGCDFCDGWMHLTCTELDVDTVNFLRDTPFKNSILYKCDSCQKNCNNKNEIQELKKELKEDIVKDLKQCLPSLFKEEMVKFSSNAIEKVKEEIKEVKEEKSYAKALLANMNKIEKRQEDTNCQISITT